MNSISQGNWLNNKIKNIIKNNDVLYSVFKKLNKLLFGPIVGVFFDLYTIPHNCPKISIKDRIIRTADYRLANMSFFISENVNKLSSFHNIHKDKRCFIIGNGPSLNNLDLKFLKNEFTFGVNAIYTNFEKMNFLPTYYVVEDVFVAEDRAEEINVLKGPQKFFGNYLSYCLNDASDVNWINVIFRYDNYKNFPHFSENALRRVWTGGTVSYICMQLAYYMGFNEVYLIGFDHSYTIPDTAEVSGTNIISTGDDINHFNSDYFGAGKRWHDPMVDRMETAYEKAKMIFEKSGRKIFNASAGGNLEVFKRVEFASIFKEN